MALRKDEDPAVMALRVQTEAIRASVDAMRQASLDSRLQAAEQARSSLDTVFRLTSGQGLGAFGSTREDRDGKTLLSRVTLSGSSPSVGKLSAANPYVATAEQAPAAAQAIAPTPSAALERRTLISSRTGKNQVAL